MNAAHIDRISRFRESVGSTLLVVLLLNAGFLIAAGFTGYTSLQDAQERYIDAVTKTVDLNRTLDEATSKWKAQVGAWKNVLLRGHEPEDYHSNLALFYEAERGVRKSIRALGQKSAGHEETVRLVEVFLARHQQIGLQYRDAMRIFNQAEADAHSLADRAIWQADEAVGNDLDAIDQSIEHYIKDSIQTVEDETRQTRLLLLSVVFVVVLLSLVIGFWVFNRRILIPLAIASATARRIALGDLETTVPAGRRDELGALLRSLDEMRGELERSHKKILTAQADIQRANAGLEQRVKERTTELEREIVLRKAVEERLRDSQERLAGILELAPEAVIVTNDAYKIELFNQGAERVFGIKADEIMGKSLEMLFPEQTHARFPGLFDVQSEQTDSERADGPQAEILARREDRSEFPAAISVGHLEQNGEIRFIVLMHDISDRKRTERQIITAKEEAEMANAAKTQFLAHMSHELRTPLNSIIGFSDLISSEIYGGVGDPKYSEYAGLINQSGKHLLQIIKDILDVSRIETGNMNLTLKPLDVPSVLEDCHRLMTERARHSDLTLSTSCDAGLGMAFADELRLKQIILNLLSNAIKFTPSGGRITLSARSKTPSEITIEVIDTGIGIKAKDIAKILEPFSQVGDVFSNPVEGTGLGLYISKRFAEAQNGSLEIESRPDSGTTVRVTIPTALSDVQSHEESEVGRPTYH